jgi:hypothetical protein
MGAGASSAEAAVVAPALEELHALSARAPALVRGKVLSVAEEFLREAAERYCQSDVEVTVFRCANLDRLDTASPSDPYVVASLVARDGAGRESASSTVTCRTSVVQDNEFPEWGSGAGERLVVGPASGQDELVLWVFDLDGEEPNMSTDQLIGWVRVPLANAQGSGGAQWTEVVEGNSVGSGGETGSGGGGAPTHNAGTLTFSFRRLIELPATGSLDLVTDALGAWARALAARCPPSTGAAVRAAVSEFARQVFEAVEPRRGDAPLQVSQMMRYQHLMAAKGAHKSVLHRLFAAALAGSLAAEVRAIDAEEASQVVFKGISLTLSRVGAGESKTQDLRAELQAFTKAGFTLIAKKQQHQQQGKTRKGSPSSPGAAVPVAAPVPQFVTRREIRGMSDAEQLRVIAAIKQSMRSSKAGGSEWLRIAGYHGWPSNAGNGYCAHRAETFPGWHRAYLLEMEVALSCADRELGNDGMIGLPYWDFARYKVGGQVMPALFREHFGKAFRFPDNFWPVGQDDPKLPPSRASVIERFKVDQFSLLFSEERLLDKLASARVAERVAECLDVTANAEHWQFASSENSEHESLEGPHNMVHNALGFPLTNLQLAAFHPMFWLLHCNVDRVYEKYLEMTTRQECHNEMLAHQRILAESGRPDLLAAPLAPFAAPDAQERGEREQPPREYFRCEHALRDLHELGYGYDELPPNPGQQLREAPVEAVFRRVDVAFGLRAGKGQDPQGYMKSFDLHVLLAESPAAAAALRRRAAAALAAPAAARALLSSREPAYAGSASLFGGKGEGCDNCETGVRRVTVRVSLNDVVARLGLRAEELEPAALVVVAEDEFGELCLLEDVAQRYGEGVCIPAPHLHIPLLSVLGPELSEQSEAASLAAVRQLERALHRLGFFEQLDISTTQQQQQQQQQHGKSGALSAATADAVRRFQRSVGIRPNGVVGSITRAAMLQSRHDRRGGAELGAAAATGCERAGGRRRFHKGQCIKYWVGTAPGYLSRDAVLSEVGAALDTWAATGLVSFLRVEEQATADVTLSWLCAAADGDGAGGEVARADKRGITFDVSDRWATAAADLHPRSFRLRPVVLHEVGHVLGLTHSEDPRSVMAPYYFEGRLKLSQGDIDALKALYRDE